MPLPAAEQAALLEAFLLVQAPRSALPVQLYARGEELYHRLAAAPPRLATWGRFLVALGTLAANAFTFFSATLVNCSTSPLCSHGAPQHDEPVAIEHSTPLRSYTFTRSWPICGCWYSTRHVGNTATRPCRLAMRTRGR